MSIVLERLNKGFGGQSVVSDLSLEIGDGELFVLLGPSGSGKSTVLRMIAGLSEMDSGRVLLNGRDVSPLPPQKRGVGFVFQNYALFRAMTVSANVEFALKVRQVKSAERARRRDELLELVGLAGLGARLPRQLSGGQQQRVALARALAHRPEILLLDEPFGALDARIRAELRLTIRTIQRELKVTTIFVTHDQEEAFELADRMGVLHFGRLLEVGPPQELYLRPQTEFVATFLGTANLMVGESTPRGVRLGPVEFPLAAEARESATRRVQVLFRPEDVALTSRRDELAHPVLGSAVVERSTFVGSTERLLLRLPPLPGTRSIAPQAPFGSESILIEASRSQHQVRRLPLEPGSTTWVGVRHVHALAHPGLALLLVADGSSTARHALALGGEIARRAHARLTLLGPEQGSESAALREAREQLGAIAGSADSAPTALPLAEAIATESSLRQHDLLVVGAGPELDDYVIGRLIDAGAPNLLLVPAAAPIPERILISVAVGEPGKRDVSFAGRLARHLGSELTVLTVQRADEPSGAAERFLAAAVRTLAQVGVQARSTLRRGDIESEIEAELAASGPGMLVLGMPLTRRRGHVDFGGVVAGLLHRATIPVLLVRSDEVPL
ncbi:MAG: ATP-binding cassette domain-containing protein [Acidobacteriota bacterium]